MIWFTWRQFRTPAAVTACALAAFGVLLLITGRQLTELYAAVATCRGDCTGAIDIFLTRFGRSASGTLYNLALPIMLATPALIGIFWGAPLVARELETGTHRLAWNQSVTRTRWLATKVALVGGAAAVTTGLLSVAITFWARHIDSATADRITPAVFGARGLVPVGYALFAFALGVTCGLLTRRVVPAMAATLTIYLAAMASMVLWLRAYLIPAYHETRPLDAGRLRSLMTTEDRMEVMGGGVPNAWVARNDTLTPGGQIFTGPPDPTACGHDAAPRACEAWLNSLNLRQDIVYHPASHFWALQWAETGVFVGLAALLTGFCFWWIRRRVT